MAPPVALPETPANTANGRRALIFLPTEPDTTRLAVMVTLKTSSRGYEYTAPPDAPPPIPLLD